MSGRKESFWDGLGPEIYGVRPGILACAEYFPRAEHYPTVAMSSEPHNDGWVLLIPSGMNMEGSEGTFRAGGGNFLVGPENQGAPHRSRAPGHPRSSRFNLTYCGVPENKSGIFLEPQNNET